LGRSELIRAIDIQGFRGIRRLSKPIELSSFNVLVGRNNVGKTAILEALYMLTMPFRELLERSIPPYNESPKATIENLHGGPSSLVYGYSGEARIIYDFDRIVNMHDLFGLMVSRVEVILKESGQETEIWLDGRVIDLKNYGIYETFLKKCGCGLDRDIASLYIPDHSGYYAKLLDFALREEVIRYAEKHGLHRKVVEELISKTIYDRFTEILVRRDRLSLRKEAVGGVGPLYINLESVGEGVKRFVLIYMATEYLNPRILLWDDVEVAAHPGLVEVILEWLASSKRQIVISTHSFDVLHTLTIVRPRDCRVIVLRKTQDDVVSWRALNIDEVEELVDRDIDIRKIVDELETG